MGTLECFVIQNFRKLEEKLEPEMPFKKLKATIVKNIIIIQDFNSFIYNNQFRMNQKK